METEEIYYNGYKHHKKNTNFIENLKQEIAKTYKDMIISLIKNDCNIEAQKKTKSYIEIMNLFNENIKFEDD